MKTLEIKRSEIQDFLENVQTADSYFIGTSEVHWIADTQEWMLKLADGSTHFQNNGCGDLIKIINDTDIEEYYQELVEDWFDEETA